MKKYLLIAGLVLLSGSAYAVTATGTAKAIIKKALTVTEQTPMNFATIQTPSAGGTVTISSAGVVSTSATGFTFSGTPAAGNFSITGDASTPVTVTFTNGTLTGPGTSMSLQNFTTTPASSITIGSGGTLSLSVGADLVVGANQTAGTYNGSYQITVSY